MSLNWGPAFIVPSPNLKELTGHVRLRERYDESLLSQELDALGMTGPVIKISNPWYLRKKGEETWIKIGESDNRTENFPVSLDTSLYENGDYEVLGQMHVFVKEGDSQRAIARQHIMEVTIAN